MNRSICLVGGGLRGGGQERALTNLANFAAEKGYEVYILNLFKTEVFFDLHPSIQLIWPALERENTHRLVYALKLIPFIRRSVKQINPRVILSFGEWFNHYVILATRGTGVPVFVSDRMGPDLYLGSLVENMRKITYKHANGIIAQTSIAAQKIQQKTGARKIKVIPNAVKTIEAPPCQKKEQIVTVGRLSREKGHVYLIKAFARIAHLNWELHIVGDGPERPHLEQECRKLGIEKQVVFRGYQQDFSRILAESAFFVLPSLYEGFPNALLEAMSVPLPCISTNCVAGPSDIIQSSENGLLVPVEDEEALANAMQHLIETPETRQRLAKKALEVREKYNFEKLGTAYIEYLLGTPEKLVKQ